MSLFALVATGCGEGGAASGATVSIYAAAPLCKQARHELQRAGGEADNLRVRATCLPATDSPQGTDLAQAGANARRATEDATTVAYLEAPGPAAKFTQQIVESAEITWIKTTSGTTATHHILQALQERGSSTPRTAVRETLHIS